MSDIYSTLTRSEGAFDLAFDRSFDSLFSGRVHFPAPTGYLRDTQPYDPWT